MVVGAEEMPAAILDDPYSQTEAKTAGVVDSRDTWVVCGVFLPKMQERSMRSYPL